MSWYANMTNGKLTVTNKPIQINGISYDPKKDKNDIKGFKWFKSKSDVYKHYGINQNSDKQLFYVELSNGTDLYCVGVDEMDCRDKVSDYIETRFFVTTNIYITNMEQIGETQTKGMYKKLVL